MTHVSDVIDHIRSRIARLPAGWHAKYPTNKQHAVLVDRGYRVPMTRGEAATLIRQISHTEGWSTNETGDTP